MNGTNAAAIQVDRPEFSSFLPPNSPPTFKITNETVSVAGIVVSSCYSSLLMVLLSALHLFNGVSMNRITLLRRHGQYLQTNSLDHPLLSTDQTLADEGTEQFMVSSVVVIRAPSRR